MKTILYRLTVLLAASILPCGMFASTEEEKAILSRKITDMFIANEYDSVATLAFRHFVAANSSRYFKVLNDDGTLNVSLVDHLPSRQAKNRKKYFYYDSLKPILGSSEFDIYYYGALACYKLAEQAWDVGEKENVLYNNDVAYNSNYNRIVYDFVAYLFADMSLADMYLDMKNKAAFTEEQMVKLYDKAIVMQELKIRFDTRYYEQRYNGRFINEISHSATLLTAAQKPSAKEYTRLKKEREIYKKKNLPKQEEPNYFDDLDDIKKLENTDLPYLIKEYQDTKDLHDNIANYNQTLHLQMLDGYLAQMQNIYQIKKSKHTQKLTPLILDATIARGNAMMRLKGASCYEKYIDIRWSDIRNSLDEGDCAIQFFEMTNIYDRWLMGYVISRESDMPELKYFGHSYWAEEDAFSRFNQRHVFPTAKRIFYAGLNNMSVADAEGDNNNIYRLHSLSELCFPKKAANSNAQANMVVANIDYGSRNSQNAEHNRKGNSGYMEAFEEDAQLVESISSMFKGTTVLKGMDATKEKLTELLQSKAYGFVHISTHGVYDTALEHEYNETNPYGFATGKNTQKSLSIILSNYNNDNSSAITAFEISRLNLSAINMVFLSACDTGVGNINEMNISTMAQAFHIAGVQNVIAFTGGVYPDDADLFSRLFYEKVKEGMSYHDAFHFCKNNYMFSQSQKEGTKIIMWE